MKRPITILLASLGLAFAAAPAPAREFTVVMGNMTYAGIPTDAKVGDAIIWVNDDTVQHSVTAKDGSFDLRLLPGKRGRTVLAKAGNLDIRCIMHPMMRTMLKVAPK